MPPAPDAVHLAECLASFAAPGPCRGPAWRRVWWTNDLASDRGRAAAISPDGSLLFISAHIGGAVFAERATATLAYETATGTLVWAASTPDLILEPRLRVGPDGATVYLSGRRVGDAIIEARAAASGVLRWTALFDGPSPGPLHASDTWRGIQASADRVFVAGETCPPDLAVGCSALIAAYDAATGAHLWNRSIPAATSNNQRAYDIILQKGSVVAGGHLHEAGADRAFVAAYGPDDGAERWRFVSNASGEVFALASDPSAPRLYAAGAELDAYVAAYDSATGRQEWRRTLPGWTAAGRVEAGTGGRIVVGGRQEARAAGLDALNGKLQWNVIFNPPGAPAFRGGQFALADEGRTAVFGGEWVPVWEEALPSQVLLVHVDVLDGSVVGHSWTRGELNDNEARTQLVGSTGHVYLVGTDRAPKGWPSLPAGDPLGTSPFGHVLVASFAAR